jgi:oxygen-independent coproporphyrinogen-3 oxidase
MTHQPSCGLYIHIPFCHQRCHFCAFSLEIHQARLVEQFLPALLREMEHWAYRMPFAGQPLDSVYFGGGTPTTIASEDLVAILTAARERFGLRDDAEVTVEAHPSSVSEESLSRLRTAGVNRISLGAESLETSELHLVGRPGSRAGTVNAVAMARKAGFDNINLDLIYGLPRQTLESWSRSLKGILDLDPSHISCYALTVEEGTHLHDSIQRGVLAGPDEDHQNEMEDHAEDILARAGFVRYEISNYCRNGSASRHNLLYWTDGRYLGLGPSAQSYVGARRWGNVYDLSTYLTKLRAGSLPLSTDEALTVPRMVAERMMFGLRLSEGVRLDDHFTDLPAGLPRRLDELQRRGLLVHHGALVRLTPLGRRHFDSVAVDLLLSFDETEAAVRSVPLTSEAERVETE